MSLLSRESVYVLVTIQGGKGSLVGSVDFAFWGVT